MRLIVRRKIFAAEEPVEHGGHGYLAGVFGVALLDADFDNVGEMRTELRQTSKFRAQRPVAARDEELPAIHDGEEQPEIFVRLVCSKVPLPILRCSSFQQRSRCLLIAADVVPEEEANGRRSGNALRARELPANPIRRRLMLVYSNVAATAARSGDAPAASRFDRAGGRLLRSRRAHRAKVDR